MFRLIGNALIFFICALIQFNIFGITQINIVIMLIAFIISVMGINMRNTLIYKVCISIYLITCLFTTLLIPYIPVMLWIVTVTKINFINILAIFNIIIIVRSCNHTLLFYIVIVSALTIFISHILTKLDELTNKLKLLRDSSREHEIFIEEKNLELLKRQDAEIYTATLKERNRIARDIHDNVGHILTRSILQTGAIKTINKDENLAEPLNTLHDTLNTAMTNIRESVHDLHDESIDLKSAVSEIIKNIDKIKITFDYDMGKNIPRNIKYCFINVVKESINNTIKHSNADTINIILREHPGFYQLLIEDNGKNININHQNGIGLGNIQDRVNSLGGNMKISTDKGFGLLISIFKERNN